MRAMDDNKDSPVGEIEKFAIFRSLMLLALSA